MILIGPLVLLVIVLDYTTEQLRYVLKRISRPQNDPYFCKVCGEFFVVPSLARCCEMKHEGYVFVRREENEPRKDDGK